MRDEPLRIVQVRATFPLVDTGLRAFGMPIHTCRLIPPAEVHVMEIEDRRTLVATPGTAVVHIVATARHLATLQLSE